MSPVAISAPEEKRPSPTPRKSLSFPLPSERQGEAARSRAPEETQTSSSPVARRTQTPPTVAPAAPPAVIQPAEVMPMQAAYGNAALARAASTGKVAMAASVSVLVGGADLSVPAATAKAAVTVGPVPVAPASAPSPTPGPGAVPMAAPADGGSPVPVTIVPASAPVASGTPGGPPVSSQAPYTAAPKAGATESPSKASGEPGISKTPTTTKAGAAVSRKREPRREKATQSSAHEALAPVVHAIRQRAAGARKHSPASVPVASAQAAAINPGTEQKRAAAMQTVANLDANATKTKKVKRDDFKTKLKEAIEKATPQPKKESQAKDVMKTGAAKANETMRGQLAGERDAAAGPLKSAASADTEVRASSQPRPHKTNLVQEPMGALPAPVAAAAAVPAPLPSERLDYSSDRAPTDRAMAESGITQEQLEKGKEPEFNQTLSSRATAEQHEAKVEASYRKGEANVREQAEHVVHAEIAQGLTGMHSARVAQIGNVVGQQVATRSKQAAEHQRITDAINGIKNKTRGNVDEILKSMESESGKAFEAGLARAETAYKDTFEEAKGGMWTRLTTWGSDWEELIETSLAKARKEYLRQVDMAIDEVADIVDSKLEAAKRRVADGWKEVESFVKGLGDSVRQYGEEALKSVSADFDAMTKEVDQRRDALVDKLTQQYKSSYERMSAMEEKLREENKSLWQRVYDATVGVIKKILAFKDMLLSVLSRAASVIGTIITHPIDFLGNLIDAGKRGFLNFVDHIWEHLKQGFMEWLFGAVAEAGIQLPKNFDPPGILSLVLQILGLTYANIRSRAVKILGEKVVKVLEGAAEIFKILITKGPAGLWEYTKEKIGDLKSMVIDKIKSFVMEKIITAGVTWLIGLLNPASAFFKACKAIYDIIMFFVNHERQILDLVNTIIDSIASIAKGQIAAAASWVEKSLARTIPVIIGFLAALLGVGGITEKIKEVIEAIRKPINAAIDWVINKAVDMVKAVGGFIGIGKDESKEPGAKEDRDVVKVSLTMAGESHVLAMASTPGAPVEMSSKDHRTLSMKIDDAIGSLNRQGKKEESADLRAIREVAVGLSSGKQEKSTPTSRDAAVEERRKKLEGLVKNIETYAADYQKTDITKDEGRPPEVGTYADLRRIAVQEKKGDEPSREAHHVPERKFGESMAYAMAEARKEIKGKEKNKEGGAATVLQEAASNLEAKTAGAGENLSAILINHKTHTVRGEASRVHGSKIRGPLEQWLVLEGLDKSDVTTTTKGEIVVKAGGPAYERHIERKLEWNAKSATEKLPGIMKEIYHNEESRAVGAVTAAVLGSTVDGPQDEKVSRLQHLRIFARAVWTAMLDSLFR